MARVRMLLFSALVLGLGAEGGALIEAGDTPPVLPDAVGGGEYVFRRDLPEITEEQRREIQAAIDANIRMLEREGRLPPQTEAHPLMGWPLRAAAGLTDPGYHGVCSFVDHNSLFPNQLRDYECGPRTYDVSSGYNHQGTDYCTWPFGWLKMDNDDVEVVAAAPGTVVYRQDGCFDRSCSWGESPCWNAVYVRHADSSVVWYGHLKNGSVTPKPVGDTVAQGEYLGVVGSSGNSNGPHLHMEVYDSDGILNDPYQGSCNTWNGSWWAAQRPYDDSAVNRVATSFAAPSFPPCPDPERPNETGTFFVGSRVYFTAYYRDQRSSQESEYRVYRPDGSLHNSWTHSSPADHYAMSWWYFLFQNFAPSGPTGLWRYEVTFGGQTYVHPFQIIDVPPGRRASSLRVDKLESGDLALSWAPSCSPYDADYEVFEGSIGAFYSHSAVYCSVGNVTSTTLYPSEGNTYYLVVPNNGRVEGSYGLATGDVERPPAGPGCLTHLPGGCPP